MVSVASTNHPDSWYHASAVGLVDYPRLEQDQDCDVCVIGGGFTGLSAALCLAEKGYDVVLLEGRRIGWGASGRNGGQIGTGQHADQDDLEVMVGEARARALWQLAEDAKAAVETRIRDFSIDCHLAKGLLYTCLRDAETQGYRDHARHLNERYGYADIRYVDRDEIAALLGTTIYRGGTLDMGGGHLHPLNYAIGLARAAAAAGVRIFEQAVAEPVQDKGGKRHIRAGANTVTAREVVIAVNGYLEKLEPRMAPWIMPINNYIVATEPLGEERAQSIIADNLAVADSKFVVDYYRLSHDNRLLFGGGESYGRRFPKDIAGLVRRCMLRVFPQLGDVNIDYAWGGTLAITLSRLPSAGRLGEHIHYVQGYSGTGVALSTIAGQAMAESISGDSYRFDLFENMPKRRFPGGTLLRRPGQVAGMLYYGLRDRLGV